VPGGLDTALISAGFAVVHPSGSNTITGLTINATNSLDVTGGTLLVTGDTALAGTLRVSGTGSVTLQGLVNSGGTATGWKVYKAHPSGTTIDVGNAQDYCVDIQAPFVILQGVTMRNARMHGMRIGNVSDVVVEGCDETRKSTQLTFSSSRFVLEHHRAARTSRRARRPAHFYLDLSHHVLDVSPRGAPGTVHTARVRSGRVRISTSCRLARICGSAGYRQAI
jgi:hypothetical protein